MGKASPLLFGIITHRKALGAMLGTDYTDSTITGR